MLGLPVGEEAVYGIGHNQVPHPRVFPPEGGACKGKPTHWWFPEFFRTQKAHEKRSVLNVADHAKRICSKCPIRAECLDYSLKHEPWGIWGGFDEWERVRIAIADGIVPTRSRLGQKVPSGRPVGRPRNDDVPAYG